MENDNSGSKPKSAEDLTLWMQWCGAWLKKLEAAFRAELSEETASVYFEELSRYSIAALRPAFKRVLQECRFFPTVAEIREFAREANREGQERAYERLKQRQANTASPKMLKSILDLPEGLSPAERAARLGALPREKRLMLGIEEPRVVDQAGRLAELLRQAEELKARGSP